MKVLLDIKDSKATSLMDVLNGLPYVKVKQISDAKALLIEELKEAIEEINLVKAGKKSGRPARMLLDEI